MGAELLVNTALEPEAPLLDGRLPLEEVPAELEESAPEEVPAREDDEKPEETMAPEELVAAREELTTFPEDDPPPPEPLTREEVACPELPPLLLAEGS